VSEDLAIAVIDDDESFRVAVVESLSSLGYGAIGFACAEDYLRGYAGEQFACVVTDIHMPGMSGLDLTKCLTARGSTTPIVAITARSDPSLKAKVAAAGAVRLLRKPFEINDLIKCIEEAVKEKTIRSSGI
jgi:FixJ family two-component response regulator